MKYAIALDIGGTSIKYTLVNQNGDILYESSETTQSKENPRPLSDIIKSIVREVGYCNQLQRIRTKYNEVADFQRLFYLPKIQL